MTTNMHYTINDHNDSSLILHERYIRFANRIFDSSTIATVRVKKNKVLFNSFKQNTSHPTLSVTFKTESEAVQVLEMCANLYRVSSATYYADEEEKSEYYLPDAYGTSLVVTPEYLNYRNRIVSASEVKTVSMKGKRVLVNNFKGNVSSPTMCVHFKDKDTAFDAMNRIHSVLWNTKLRVVDKPSETEKPEPAEDIPSVLTAKADPMFLNFVMGMTGVLLFLQMMRAMIYVNGSGDGNDEL